MKGVPSLLGSGSAIGAIILNHGPHTFRSFSCLQKSNGFDLTLVGYYHCKQRCERFVIDPVLYLASNELQ